MKGNIIHDALAVNPLAEFACKPGYSDTKVVRVRGLKYVNGGTWTVAESTDPITGVWKKIGEPKLRMASRELTTVEDAEAQVQATIARNVDSVTASRKADQVVQMLEKLGVAACKRMGRRVVVDDVAGLGRLLAKVST
jgi:hypothetical protein